MKDYLRALVNKLATPVIKRQCCDHCGRPDLGTPEAGYAEVVTARGILKVCSPTVNYRPRCNRLIKDWGHNGHGRNCWICAWANPHGGDVVRPKRGRWAHV